MLGVTVGGDGNRTHRIFMIGQRGILEILHSRGVPFIMSDTGGRVKPLPMRPDKLKNLGMLTEPGLYYLYTDHTVQIDDFHYQENGVMQVGSWKLSHHKLAVM